MAVKTSPPSSIPVWFQLELLMKGFIHMNFAKHYGKSTQNVNLNNNLPFLQKIMCKYLEVIV